MVVRVESGLFFANADHVRDADPRAVADASASTRGRLDAETVPFVDVTAAADARRRSTATSRRRGTRLLLARDIGQVRDVLRRAGADPCSTPCTRASTPP